MEESAYTQHNPPPRLPEVFRPMRQLVTIADELAHSMAPPEPPALLPIISQLARFKDKFFQQNTAPPFSAAEFPLMVQSVMVTDES
jgi:hypothetical protein